MSNKEKNKKCKEYWLKKGLSAEESINKSNIEKKEGNQYCIEHWIKKGLCEEESKKNIERIKKENNKFQVEYWIKRGYNLEESLIIIENERIKTKNNSKVNSVYFKEYWIKNGFSEEDAIKNVEKNKKENSIWCVEYWIKRGFSEEDSISKITEYQKNNTDKRTIESYKNMLNPYMIEYWKERGFSNVESMNHIIEYKERTNPYLSLDNDKIKSMIENRKKTYYSKTEDERKLIRDKKVFNKEKYIKRFGEEKYKKMSLSKGLTTEKFIEKHGEEKYKIYREKKISAVINRTFRKTSKISMELFDNIIDETIKKDSFYGKNEKCLIFNEDKKYAFYVDFIYNNKIIEFYGDYFHANPKIYNENKIIGSKYKHITAKEKWKNDKQREDILIKNGYEILIIWESDYKSDKKTIIEKCKEWIKNS